MSIGQHGYGTVLTFGGTTVANVTQINGPNETVDSIDISTMDSANKIREFIPGMIDTGELSLDLNYDQTSGATASSLQTFKTMSAQAVVLTLIDGTVTSKYEGNGFITALGHAIPFEDKVTQSCTIKLTGALTYTDAI